MSVLWQGFNYFDCSIYFFANPRLIEGAKIDIKIQKCCILASCSDFKVAVLSFDLIYPAMLLLATCTLTYFDIIIIALIDFCAFFALLLPLLYCNF